MAQGLADIPALHWTPLPGGLFAFTRVDGCHDSVALAIDLLERAHVVTIPGSAFGTAGEGFLRLSYGYASLDDLGEAMTRLREYFRTRT
jgi:aminotransferase